MLYQPLMKSRDGDKHVSGRTGTRSDVGELAARVCFDFWMHKNVSTLHWYTSCSFLINYFENVLHYRASPPVLPSTVSDTHPWGYAELATSGSMLLALKIDTHHYIKKRQVQRSMEVRTHREHTRFPQRHTYMLLPYSSMVRGHLYTTFCTEDKKSLFCTLYRFLIQKKTFHRFCSFFIVVYYKEEKNLV